LLYDTLQEIHMKCCIKKYGEKIIKDRRDNIVTYW
jgi:hypothetical protein